MHDIKDLMRDHYIRYASYVILDRAIPDLIDGLKPVQRRILHTLYSIHDGKFHKVANVTGQTMAYHPHGDAPIYEALVTLANKGYLLDMQGNFGNPSTGDPAAAARYIETRLKPIAMETLFNPKLTQYTPSYDGRNQEPVLLPAKIPLLLLLGADGIAVGMATKILPHNFVELISAEIDLIRGKPIQVFPDFPSGGILDASSYEDGKGKVKVRAVIIIKDPKTLVIRELAYSTTTDSVIQSIEDAVKKGHIKIDSISDFTAEKVEIEIKLPRGQYAEEVIDALYAYSECEVSIQPQMVVIHEGSPKEVSVSYALQVAVDNLKKVLEAELHLLLEKLSATVYLKTLERIFIEEKLYQKIEELGSEQEAIEILLRAFIKFKEELLQEPTVDDINILLSIPIRRIARFDREKNLKEIDTAQKEIRKINKELEDIDGYAVRYLEGLLKRFSHLYPRRTRLESIGQVDKKAISTKKISVGYDLSTGYVGLKVDGEKLSCTNYDKIVCLYKDGLYKVLSIPEKQYMGRTESKLMAVFPLDKEEIFNCCYLDSETGFAYAKRFQIKQFLVDKEYRFLESGQKLLFFSQNDTPVLHVMLVPKPKQRVAALEFEFKDVAVKGVSAHGIRISPRPVLDVQRKKDEVKKNAAT